MRSLVVKATVASIGLAAAACADVPPLASGSSGAAATTATAQGGVAGQGAAPAGGAGSPSLAGDSGTGTAGAAGAGNGGLPATSSGAGGGGSGGAADGVTLGGPSLPCTFAFCEGFEDYADGAHPKDARWTETQGTDQVVVTSAKPARGQRSLHITFEANPRQTHWMRTSEPFPTLSRQHYGRIFVYIQQLPDQKLEYRHWVTVEMHPNNGPVLRVLGGETPPNIGANSNDITKQNSAMFDLITPGEDRRREDNVNIGDKKWLCFEWSLDVDANSYRMWLDGVAMPGASWDHSNPTYTFQPISYLWLGWTDWHNDSANWEVYLDEVALDSNRIGCNR